MWRHGDILIAPAERVPHGAVRRNGTVLVRGESAGQGHRIAEPYAAEIWELGAEMYLNVVDDAVTLVHERHKPILLPRGLYRIWVQRECAPTVARRILE